MSRAAHQLCNQTSGEVEWYSPPEVIDRVHRVLGGIDLDPASCEVANRRVRAERIFTAPKFDTVGELGGLPVRRYHGRGGLDADWSGRNVWMNPPFLVPESACLPRCTKATCRERGWHTATALPGTADWLEKLAGDYRSGKFGECCCITFAATSEAWFQPLMRRPQCFPKKRTNYYGPDGRRVAGVSKGSAVTYFGPNLDTFAREFSELGVIKIAYLP